MRRYAKAAKIIRTSLRKLFPKVWFKVWSKSYTGADLVEVQWIDGPLENMVRDVIEKYRSGEFTGIESMPKLPFINYYSLRRVTADEFC